MPVRKCKNCPHSAFMHPGGPCQNMIRDEQGNKIERCPCPGYEHDPASGPEI